MYLCAGYVYDPVGPLGYSLICVQAGKEYGEQEEEVDDVLCLVKEFGQVADENVVPEEGRRMKEKGGGRRRRKKEEEKEGGGRRRRRKKRERQM